MTMSMSIHMLAVTFLIATMLLPVGHSKEQFSKRGESELMHEVTSAEDNLISDIKMNTTEHGEQPLFRESKRNLTFDSTKNPMVSINSKEVDEQNSLLSEHDERYHDDFPGHETILPLSEKMENNSKNSNDNDHTTNCEVQSIKLSIEESSLGEPRCFLKSSFVHPSLSGHVDSDDEEYLTEMIVETPPKLVRHRRAFFNPDGKSRIWPNGQYAYVFDNNIEAKPKEYLLRAFKEIGEKVPCIKFVPADENTQLYIIHTSRNMAQCSSDTLGYMPGVQALINVGSFCDYGLVMHEVFHALGAIHTQNRPDRSKFVRVEWENIDPKMAHNFRKKEGVVEDTVNEYDYKSAMHYPANSFNIDQKKPSIVSLNNTIKLKDYGHYVLDEQDYESLRRWYGCPRSAANTKPKPEGRKVDRTKNKMNKSDKDNRGLNHTSPPKSKTFEEIDESDWKFDCVVGPWSEWSECTGGFKAKKRIVAPDDVKCPTSEMEIRCRPKRPHQLDEGSINPPPKPSQTESLSDSDFAENSDKAVTHLKKTVRVVEGQPIVLVVSNPQNFPVRWYQVIGGEDKELPEGKYTILRTPAGNNRLHIPRSTLEGNNGQLFVSKIAMKKTVLRVAWNVEVLSEDQYFSNMVEVGEVRR